MDHIFYKQNQLIGCFKRPDGGVVRVRISTCDTDSDSIIVIRHQLVKLSQRDNQFFY